MKNFTLLLMLLSISQILYSQATPCDWVCEEPEADGCFYCDANELSGSYEYSYFTSIELGPANDLCPGSLPSNTLWFVFVAGAEEMTITFEVGDCPNVDANLECGLQDGCEGECIMSVQGCQNAITTISTDELVAGNTYAFWVDGCGGAVCDFELDISGQVPFEIDEPSHISVYSECKEDCLTADCLDEIVCTVDDEVFVCPGEEVTFIARHQGDSVSDFGEYDAACSTYAPHLNAEFEWSFDGSLTTLIPSQNGGPNLTMLMPLVEDETTFELCLSSIYSDSCEDANTDTEACIQVTIIPVESETYRYEVCAEDLDNYWEIPEDDDPNGDGVTWLGPKDVHYDDVVDWDDGCNTFELLLPECNCPVEQTLCITILGSIEPVNTTLYMYDCQFDEDGEYEWEWPYTTDDQTLENYLVFSEYLVEEGSILFDYEFVRCDSFMRINVETYELTGQLIQTDCGIFDINENIGFGIYDFNLDLNFLKQPEYQNWPKIEPDYTIMWVDCSDPSIVFVPTGDGSFLYEDELGTTDDFCIKATYTFYDGAWGDSETSPIVEETSCEKIFGPYQLTAGCEDNITSICPSLGLPQVTVGSNAITSNEAINFDDLVGLNFSLDASPLPNGALVEWWISDNPSFIPGQEGNLLGAASVTSNWSTGQQTPELLAISYRDPFDMSEYFVVGSGSGFYINELIIELDNNCDSSCPAPCSNEVYGTQCPWKKSNNSVLNNCSNIIPVGPGDYVPPNSIVVVYIDEDEENLIRSAEALCSDDDCIYVLFNECHRCLDAFADEGQASYTLRTNAGASTLSYIANPDGGSINNQGEYAFDRAVLPEIKLTQYELETQTPPSVIGNLNCLEYSGTYYLRAAINSAEFPYDCCHPYSQVFTLNLQCEEDPPPPPNGEPIFNDFPFLTALVDTNNCLGVTVSVYEQGIYNYLLVESETESILYFQDGTQYCINAPGFSCVAAYGLGSPVVIWTCSQVPPPPPPGSDPQVFLVYTWLDNIVDRSDCEGTVVSVYELGVYRFIQVQTVDQTILYFQDGTVYCTNALGFNCLDVYGLGSPVSVWHCGGSAPIPQLFADYPWLQSLIDLQDCSDYSIEIYQSGTYQYFFIDSGDGLLTMYDIDGNYYCGDGPGFSCFEAYGFTSVDLIETWDCVGFQNQDLESRATKHPKTEILLYPNPATTELHIKIENGDTDLNFVEIYDLNGEQIRIIESLHSNHVNINVSDLDYSGIYLMRIATADGQYYFEKFMKY